MQLLPNRAGQDSYGETSWESGDSSENIKENVARANSTPLTLLFKYYGINFDEGVNKIICPIHDGRVENSPSFHYYPHTNTFWCFGCKKGTKPIDLVCFIEKIKRLDAVDRILNLFNSEFDKDFVFSKEDFNKKNKLLLEFSEYIRTEIQQSKDLNSIECISKVFDDLNEKYTLSNDAIESIIKKLKK